MTVLVCLEKAVVALSTSKTLPSTYPTEGRRVGTHVPNLIAGPCRTLVVL